MVLNRREFWASAESWYYWVIRIRKWPPGPHVGFIHRARDSLVGQAAVALGQHSVYAAAKHSDCRSDRSQTNQELPPADDFRPTDFAFGHQAIDADVQAAVDRDGYDAPIGVQR